MLRIGVLVSGGGTNLQAIIDACESGYIDGQIVAILSSGSKAYAVLRAKEHKIPFICLGKSSFPAPGEYESKIIRYFKNASVDLIVMAGYTVILGPEFVKAFENKVINIHPSLIPQFCGKGFYGIKVHEAVLESGVKTTGATVHFVTEDADAGPVIIQRSIDVFENDTPETLQKRVLKEVEWKILPEAVKLFAEGKIEVSGTEVRRLI